MASTIRFLVLIAVVFGLTGVLRAQQPDRFFAATDFAQWAAQGAVEQIPWQLRVHARGLTIHQRIVSQCVIDIGGRYFKQRSESGDLIAMIQVTDSAGHIYQDHNVQFVDRKNPKAKNGAFFAWHAFMLPGDYDVILALYDKGAGKRSFGTRKLRVESLNKDPLPDAWSDLPAVELLPVAPKAPDSYFLPEIVGRLRLPLAPRRPVRVELLANLTGTGRAMVSHTAYNFNLSSLLPILKTFSQVEVRGGALNIEVLDLIRRQVAFEQENAHDLDWPRLKGAVTDADPTKVDVHALQDIKHTAAFLRQEVARRIAKGAGPPDALPVLILISSSAFFDSLNDVNDTLIPSECGCVVYYIRYNPFVLRYHFAYSDYDNVKKVLKPLPVRAHIAESAQDLRRIMAEIMDDISKL
jgi:hypothetical protein